MSEIKRKILLHSTIHNDLVEFEPLDKGRVKMYVCGPTVYDSTHIGHARAAVVFDVIRRYFKAVGYDIMFVQNFTDVDDKIIARANDTGQAWNEVSEKYTDDYLKVLDALNVAPADKYPKCTDHIGEMIDLIQKLIEKDVAYAVDNDVFFDITKFAEYGKLARRDLDDEGVARIEADPRKRNPGDFGLWKSTKPGEPYWESPWGKGRPGWHIECSAMSMKYLGETFDIHAGGRDLIFPHHENEIAQAEAATGKTYVKYWLHNGMLTVDGKKMSKSLGNIINVWELLEKHTFVALRSLYLSAHYRTPIDFTWEKLEGFENSLKRLYATLDTVAEKIEKGGNVSDSGLQESVEKLVEEFHGAMCNDFNTAGAFGKMHELAGVINKSIDTSSAGELQTGLDAIKMMLGIFGLTEKYPARETLTSELTAQLLDLFVKMRNQARKDKNWALADLVRDELAALGVTIKDTPDGTVWTIDG